MCLNPIAVVAIMLSLSKIKEVSKKTPFFYFSNIEAEA